MSRIVKKEGPTILALAESFLVYLFKTAIPDLLNHCYERGLQDQPVTIPVNQKPKSPSYVWNWPLILTANRSLSQLVPTSFSF